MNRKTSAYKRKVILALSKNNRASKHWKQVEREVAFYLGGRRTPLSGMNSQHNTSADVIGCPAWMYVEVKWDKKYDKSLMPYYELMIADRMLQINYFGIPLIMFRFDTWYKKQLHGRVGFELKGPPAAFKATNVNVHQGLSQSISPDLEINVDRQHVAFNLYVQDTLVKCKRERMLGRKVAFQFHRFHFKRGLYCITDMQGLKRLSEWRRQYGTGFLTRGSKNHKGRKNEAEKRARLSGRTLPLQEARTFPWLRDKPDPKNEDGVGVY